MRKYFWGFGLCGVLLLGGVVAAANHAARHPHSVIGKVMHGASYAAARMAPGAGFAPVLANLEKRNAPPVEVDGIPDDPVPADDAAPDAEPKPDLETGSAAPIVIPEDDDAFAGSVELPRVRHEVPFGPATECPATGVCQAPAVMPRCHDEEECEVLPMPMVEADEEEQEGDAGAGCGLGGLFRLYFEMPVVDVAAVIPATTSTSAVTTPTGAEVPPAKANECREDPHHHHHYSGCPYTGRSYRGCPSGPPSVKPSCDPPKPAGTGAEEASEEGKSPPPGGSAALRKIRRFKARESIDDACPTHPGVDTLEMRPSDRQLYEYGPGSL